MLVRNSASRRLSLLRHHRLREDLQGGELFGGQSIEADLFVQDPDRVLRFTGDKQTVAITAGCQVRKQPLPYVDTNLPIAWIGFRGVRNLDDLIRPELEL